MEELNSVDPFTFVTPAHACPKNTELEHFSQAGRSLPQMNPLLRRSLPAAMYHEHSSADWPAFAGMT